MKIKYSQLSNFTLMLFFAIYYKLLYIVPLPGKYEQFTNQSLAGYVAIAIALFYLVLWKPRNVKFNYANLMIFWFAFITLEIMVSIVKYPSQGVLQTIDYAAQFCLVLIYFPLRYYLKDKRRIKTFITGIAALTLISSMKMLEQAVVFNSTQGFSFKPLQNGWIYYGVHILNGTVRIYHVVDGLTRISILLSVWLVVERYKEISAKLKVLLIANAGVSLLAILIVSQSRVYFLTMVFLILLILFINASSNKARKWILIIAALFFGVFYYGSTITSTITNLLNTVGNSRDSSFTARIRAYTYFGGCALKNPIFGNGLICSSSYYSIARGPNQIFMYDDTGIIGVLGQFGFTGVIWYLIFVIKQIPLIRKNKILTINFILLINCILCMFTQGFVDVQRIIIIPITLSVSESIYNNYEGEKK